MKIAYSAASPYVRKVMACAIARGLDSKIERWTVGTTDPALLAFNPLSKVPSFITDDGLTLFDSPVICEYLDTLGDAAPLFPPTGSAARLSAQIMHAAADGILDAAVGRRLSMPHPQDDGRKAYDARQKAAIDRALAVLEKASPKGLNDVGAIAVGCALGYLDFRFPHEPWREAHPRLAAWFAEVSKARPIAETVPVG